MTYVYHRYLTEDDTYMYRNTSITFESRGETRVEEPLEELIKIRICSSSIDIGPVLSVFTGIPYSMDSNSVSVVYLMCSM